MITNCDACTAEVEDDDILSCEACGADGMCEICHQEHVCDDDDYPVNYICMDCGDTECFCFDDEEE